MSSISNNTLSQEYYYQVAQNSATYAQSAASGTSNVDSTSGAPTSSAVINTTTPTVDPNDPSSGIAGAHHRHGGHGGGGGGGLEKLLQTVQSALSSSSSSSTDPNQVITNALQQLFGNSGDGTATDNQDSDTLIGNADTAQTAGSTSTTSSSSNSSTSTTSTDADSSVDGSDANSPSQTLAQLLQGYGVSPQQFRSDLISALSGSGGSLNESLFQNFEPGSGVDAIA